MAHDKVFAHELLISNETTIRTVRDTRAGKVKNFGGNETLMSTVDAAGQCPANDAGQ